MLSNNEYVDIPSTVEKFERDTKKSLLLTNHEISIIKSKYNEKYNNKNFYDLISNIREENKNLNFDIKSSDIKYSYSHYKNNKLNPKEREDKLIFLGTKDSKKYLDKKYSKEYFIDTTFRIIPKKFKPIKMMTISSKDENKNTVYVFLYFRNIKIR